MKWMKVVLAAAFMSSMLGCLTSETIETRIQFQGNEKPAIVTVEYGNISSGEADTSDLKKDFEELLDEWHGDQFLLDRAEKGMLVKNREVFIRDGKIVGRETGIVKDLEKLYPFWVTNGERIMLFVEGYYHELIFKGDYELVDTNGKILRTEKNIFIIWPESATELRWKQRESEPSESSEKNRPLMVKWLQEHLAKQAKTGSTR